LQPKEFPIWEVKGGTEVITNTEEILFPLRVNVCNLILRIGGEMITIEVSNADQYWRLGYNTIFYRIISKEDIEYLSRIIGDKTILISLKVKGQARVGPNILEFELGLDETPYKLGTDEFDTIFLKNTGLQYSYHRNFDLSMPVLNNLSSRPALYELFDYIATLQNSMEHALRTLRISNDYRQVMTAIRLPLDGIRALRNNTQLISDLADELYISKGVFKDLYGSGGAKTAAEQVVNQLFKLFDILFDITSKALHSKTKYPPAQQFLMFPDYCEAEFSLSLALSTTNYILDRIKLSLT
jgi:hypothetical protein